MKHRNYLTLGIAGLLGLAAAQADAAIITPTGVTGQEANGSNFPVENLINGSGMSGAGDILTQTHATSSGTTANPHWLGSIGGLNGNSPLIFDLGGTFQVDGVHIWQYTDVSSSPVFNNFGTSAFTISFSTDNGATYGNAISLTGFTLGSEGPESVQTRTFAAQSGVTNIKFDGFVAFAGQPNAGFGEVRFNEVPEPGSLALLGLGGLMMARRRR